MGWQDAPLVEDESTTPAWASAPLVDEGGIDAASTPPPAGVELPAWAKAPLVEEPPPAAAVPAEPALPGIAAPGQTADEMQTTFDTPEPPKKTGSVIDLIPPEQQAPPAPPPSVVRLPVKSTGEARASDFDFDTAKQYRDASALERGLTKGRRMLAQGAGGILQAGVELAGGEAPAIAATNKGLSRQLEAIGQERDTSTGIANTFENAVASIVSQAPGMVQAVFSGGMAVPLLYIGVSTAGQEYAQGRQAGLAPGDAMARASAFGAAEVIGERVGLPNFSKAFRAAFQGLPTEQLVPELAKYVAKEVPGEILTTTLQFGTDKFSPVGLTPQASLQDFVSQLKDTVAQTVMQVGMTSGTALGVSSASRAVQAGEAASSAEEARTAALDKWADSPLMRERSLVKERGQSVEDWLKQGDLLGRPFEQETIEVVRDLDALADANPAALRELQAEIESFKPEKEESRAPAPDVTPAAPAQAPDAEVARVGEEVAAAPGPEKAGAGEAAPVPASEVAAAGPSADLKDVLAAKAADDAKWRERLSSMAPEEASAASEKAVAHNDAVELEAVERFFGAEQKAAFEALKRRGKNAWLDANVTDEMQDYLNERQHPEDLIKEYSQAAFDFDTTSPRELGRSIAVSSRDIDKPGFMQSPAGTTLRNAMQFARAEGWSLDEVVAGMRERGAQWAGNDAPELFARLFRPKEAAAPQQPGLPKQAALAAPAPLQREATAAPEPRPSDPRAGATLDESAARADPAATKAQIEANNAKLGHDEVAGVPIAIENPAGSTRRDIHHEPPRWTTKMLAHYGRVKRAKGADGEDVDVFVKPGTPRDYKGPVFVIDQHKAGGKGFDETKSMAGWATQDEARAAYAAHYPKGWKVGPTTEMTAAEWKAWTQSPYTKRAVKSLSVTERASLAPRAMAAEREKAPMAARAEVLPAKKETAPKFARTKQADAGLDALKPRVAKDKRGMPYFLGRGVGLARGRNPMSSGEGRRHITFNIYDPATRDNGKPVKVGSLIVEMDKYGLFTQLRNIEIEKPFRQKGLGWGERVVATMLAHNGNVPIEVVNIQHAGQTPEFDALPFWRKMGVRLHNYSSNQDVQMDGTIDRNRYLNSLGERGKVWSDGTLTRNAENASGARSPEAGARKPDAGTEGGGSPLLGGERGAVRRAEDGSDDLDFTAKLRRGDEAPERGLSASGGMTVQAARKALAAVIERSKVPIVVVQSVEDAKAAGLDAPPDARGAFHEGKIYLIADNVANPLVAEITVARHEMVHAGYEALYGGDKAARRNALLDLQSKNRRVREYASAWRVQYGQEFIDAATAQGDTEAEAQAEMMLRSMEEAVAYRSEEMGKLNGWRSFVAVIQRGLRRLGLNRFADWLESASDAEARAAVADILRATESRPAPRMPDAVPQPAMAREPGGTPLTARKGFKGSSWAEKESPSIQEALRKAGVLHEQKPLGPRVRELTARFAKEFRQGMFDQFAPLMEVDYKAYMMARLSRATDGALEALMFHGLPKLTDGALDIDTSSGGGLIEKLQKLEGEHDRFLAWVAGNRAAQLKQQGRENLFTDEDISALKRLNEGKLPSGKGRGLAYTEALADFNAYGKAVLDIAEKTGLIDGPGRKVWESDFYVPFYRVLEEDDATKVAAPKAGGTGLVNQQAFKKLKGGREQLNDLLANTLSNWSHLLSASMKNQAAAAALDAAVGLKAARVIPEHVKGALTVRKEGRPVHYEVDDPLIVDALTALDFSGFRGVMMGIFGAPKKILTWGVTVNPVFRIRNLMRDTMSAIAQSPISYNPFKNLADGWKATKRGSEDRARLLAGGGMIRFGTVLEGRRADRTKRLIAAGVKLNTVLDSPQKVHAVLSKAWKLYQEGGDRGEAVNRAAVYKQLRAQGKGHLEASYEARDLLDFSMQGKWMTIRFLSQTVPFFNARLQGLYKLGRSARNDWQRVAIVQSAVILAELMLWGLYKGDEDWEAREEWDRDTYWAFKVGDVMYRLPKPFEIGAVGSIVGRLFEYIYASADEETGEKAGERFRNRVMSIIGDSLSMNPTPQAVKPLMELFANKSFFTGRAIEGTALEKLENDERVSRSTTLPAILLAKLEPTDFLSPVEVDHIVRAYFGWAGMAAFKSADALGKLAMGGAEAPAKRIGDWPVIGDFMEGMPAGHTRYIEVFYDQAKQIEEAYSTWREHVKMQREEKAEVYEEQHEEQIKRHKEMTQARNRLAALNREARRIEETDELTAQEKRDELDEINLTRNELAKKFVRQED